MRVIRILLCGLVLVGWSLVADAASYEALKPLLGDVPGWTGEAAEGASMDMEGMKMVTVSRHYQRGEAQSLNVQVGLMPGAMGASMQMTMNMETDEAVMSTTTIDGFRVHQNHEKAQNSGAVVVILGGRDEKNSALFSVDYTGISAQEAMTMAKGFDWKKMQAATAALP
ncbi:MAG: hypothetical protein Q8L79_17150 [Methylobacter sp.]|uniref:hypothetical protein n=1 Tax=Methylobacter sp. TaxID=2051955 RepID=UPI00272F4AA8|nr:hypothetical protein [Methylobacter sp.]MDP1666839.1 hypothetical protein [Methylobacter sp.]